MTKMFEIVQNKPTYNQSISFVPLVKKSNNTEKPDRIHLEDGLGNDSGLPSLFLLHHT